jgi:hypothetical protein
MGEMCILTQPGGVQNRNFTPRVRSWCLLPVKEMGLQGEMADCLCQQFTEEAWRPVVPGRGERRREEEREEGRKEMKEWGKEGRKEGRKEGGRKGEKKREGRKEEGKEGRKGGRDEEGRKKEGRKG